MSRRRIACLYQRYGSVDSRECPSYRWLENSTETGRGDHERLILAYPAVRTGAGFAAPTIQLEFGARATGEPNQVHPMSCDMALLIEGLDSPTARP